MNNRRYWQTHYVVETDPEAIACGLQVTRFAVGPRPYELLYFAHDAHAPSIRFYQGSAGHPYVFVALGYWLHRQGYNVFIMPKHGGATIRELLARHQAALAYIRRTGNDRVGVFGAGLGGFVTFYLALAHEPIGSIVGANAPAIRTEPAYNAALRQGGGAARRRKALMPVAKLLLRLGLSMKLPSAAYLDWRELIDPAPVGRRGETRLVLDGYLRDPDFDRWYPLSAILSLLTTPPPRPSPRSPRRQCFCSPPGASSRRISRTWTTASRRSPNGWSGWTAVCTGCCRTRARPRRSPGRGLRKRSPAPPRPLGTAGWRRRRTGWPGSAPRRPAPY